MHLACGGFSNDVPEIRYDVHGSGAEGCTGRYAGLSSDEQQALNEAVEGLVALRGIWEARAAAEARLGEGQCDGRA